MINELDKMISIADNFKGIYTKEYETVESQCRIVNSLLSQYGQSIEDKINSLYAPISFSDNNIIQEIKTLNDAISCLEEKEIFIISNSKKSIKARRKPLIGTEKWPIGSFQGIMLNIKTRMTLTINVAVK